MSNSYSRTNKPPETLKDFISDFNQRKVYIANIVDKFKQVENTTNDIKIFLDSSIVDPEEIYSDLKLKVKDLRSKNQKINNFRSLIFNYYEGSTKNKGWSYSTGEASSTKILTILPETSASIWLNNFIASMTQTTESFFTSLPTFTKASLSGDGFL